jgi:hypothetical protein
MIFKAYNKSLKIIFENAGYYRTPEDKKIFEKKNENEVTFVAQSLPECQSEIVRLQEEIKRLKLKT